MLKLDILITRRHDMNHAEFEAYWRDRHVALFVSQPIVKKTVRRYLQSRTVPAVPQGMPAAPFDGIAQLWFDDAAGFLEYLHSSNYKEVIQLDEQKFVDPARTQYLFSEETTVIAGSDVLAA